jgi:hypothetical protein
MRTTGRIDHMASTTHHPRSGQRDQVVFGIALMVIGLLGFVSEVWRPRGDIGGWVVMVIGLGLLAAFVYTRRHGYLVAGAVLTGLGAGILASQTVAWTSNEGEGGAVVLGLGLGFLAILVLGQFAEGVRNHWWPIVPGVILTTVGTALIIGGQAVKLLDYWGLGVVAVGLFVLWRAWTTGRTPDPGA